MEIQGPVAILGNGLTGRSIARFLKELGIHYDLFYKDGSNFLNITKPNYKYVIYSPGFRSEHPWLKHARNLGIQCLGDIDFVLQFYKGEIIAITGTNGKTTVTELLTHALTSLGIKAKACGNNEYPVGDLGLKGLKNTQTLVLELSSFQTEALQLLKPDTVILTNITEDHLDRHGNMKTYFEAKWHLVEQLKNNGQLFTTQAVIESANQMGKTLPRVEIVNELNHSVHNSPFESYPNSLNYAFIHQYFLHKGYDTSALKKAAQTYQPPKYRMEFLGELNQVKFWNDSKSTNFSSVEAALKGLSGPIYWIGGGQAKGGDLKTFLKRISRSIEKTYAYGQAGQAIQQNISCDATFYPTMEEAVKAAYKHAIEMNKHIHILFSPGFASFDQYENYKERGRSFQNTFNSCALIDYPEPLEHHQKGI